MIILLAAALLAAALVLGRTRAGAPIATALERAEPTVRRVGPILAGVAAIAILWWVWGAMNPIPRVQDESSYVLQAEIFARGRWTAPAPPVAQFFVQPHVLLEPAIASKYPPGYALLLAPGAALHFPPLTPLLLIGATTALLFLLVSRIANAWVATLACVLWIQVPNVLLFAPAYFSENATTVLVLASWWALLEWRATRRRRWIVALAFCVGWGAITRPLTMLAFAIPIGAVVLRDVIRERHWRDFSLAVATGIAVLCLLPLWNARTTGSWRLSPIEQYRRDYLPFDKYGFSFDSTPPRHALSPNLRSLFVVYASERKRQRPALLPVIALERAVKLVASTFSGAALPFLLFALIGVVVSGAAVRFAIASVIVLFVAHLGYAHLATWTVYYVEAMPIAVAVAAIGFWHVARRLAVGESGGAVATATASLVMLLVAPPALADARSGHRTRVGFNSSFANALPSLRRPAIVFVRYDPRHFSHIDVVLNSADVDHEPVWVVHSRGARNAELLQRAPNRFWYTFDEATLRFSEPHPPASVSPIP